MLAGKLTFSFACGVNKLHIPIIRVCPPQERARGWHGMKEHMPAGKLIFSFVCGDSRLHIPGNRV